MRKVLRLILEELSDSRDQHGMDVLLFHEMGSIIERIGIFTEISAPCANTDHAASAIMVMLAEKGQNHIIAAVSSRGHQSFFSVTAVFA